MNCALFSRRRIALAAIVLGAVIATPMHAAAQSVTVNVGGQPLYLNPGPIERAGRVFVPLRSIFERLGASVVYQSGTINATRHGQAISLQIGSTQATVNGQMQYLDVAPFIIGATTYVPLRFVAQSFGSNVGYDASTRVVAISMPHGGGNYVPPPVHPIPPPNPPPVSIVRLVAQQPAPGANVVNRFVTLSADFSNQVNANSVRVWLDGSDITSRCSVSRASVSYRPPAPLAFGGHTMRVAGVDAGVRASIAPGRSTSAERRRRLRRSRCVRNNQHRARTLPIVSLPSQPSSRTALRPAAFAYCSTAPIARRNAAFPPPPSPTNLRRRSVLVPIRFA